uniref:H/ACA ribonucleoprotein complex subunit 2 n=1 Tax=Dermatophagoides pteronyssinus TaxID=6956 RepID=A0A6P6XLM3_DERPT|nr:NHP2-like protein 1 homolog [Dermatophagoides pteronyssinus]
MKINEPNPKAYPLAPKELETELYNLIQAAIKQGQIRRGANEAAKALNKGRAEIIVLAADTEPIEIVLHLPLLCEDKNIPFVFVNSRSALGRACGVTRSVIALAITTDDRSPLEKQILKIRDAIEQIPI